MSFSRALWCLLLANILGGLSYAGMALALRGLPEITLQLRVGLHTGEVQPRGADVGGIAVHVAARVMGAAGDGEVLVSRTVRDLVAGSDVAFDDRGSHALKGIGGEWRLFAIRRHQTREVPP